MPVSDAYADAASYRAAMSKTDSADDGDILLDLEAVSRYIDRQMGRMPSGLPRHFTRDAAVTTRVFEPTVYGRVDPEAENPWLYTKGTRDLWVDDIAVSAGLVLKVDEDRDGSFADETALAATDYQLWPLNADKGAEKQPWTRIRLPEWSTRSGWQRGAQVEVTAVFGFPAIPSAISRATIQLTAILRLESPRATGRIPEGIDDEVEMSDPAKRIVAGLIRSYARRRVFA